MKDTTYNGWTNWETWQVPLWIDNEEPLHRAKIEFIRSTVITAKSVERFCRELFPNGTPDMKRTRGRWGLDKVNWSEIALAWKEELE